ncbi:hypothetical protein K2W90_04220 [Candidatus Babeliales bacterium]|nr:hypothetical protein [Candidatus Babeliales bacterium]
MRNFFAPIVLLVGLCNSSVAACLPVGSIRQLLRESDVVVSLNDADIARELQDLLSGEGQEERRAFALEEFQIQLLVGASLGCLLLLYCISHCLEPLRRLFSCENYLELDGRDDDFNGELSHSASDGEDV